VLREAFYAGQLERGQAGDLTGYRGRMARTVLSKLLERGPLMSESHKAKVIPLDISERWFARLYAVN